jgi:phosphoserine aminotransferase
MEKPSTKPQNPCFSSGPCAKRPGWSLGALDDSMMGRSHRAGPAKAQLQAVIDLHKALLGIPSDYLVGIVPASDTGAFEMALWSMLGNPEEGARGVDVFAWEAFSRDWMNDIKNQLKLQDVRSYEADYGFLPDLSKADPARDCVFVWNGTTSGVRVPNGDWISTKREGLTFCDATSAVFAYDMPWDRLDVVTWSWQKVLGSEGAHGMLVLSPRTVERLETYTPDRPLPKIFRMTKKGKIAAEIFEGATINTPSMLAVADCLDALKWVQSIGGLDATMARSRASYGALAAWVQGSSWAEFLCPDEGSRSLTSVCLGMKDPWFNALSEEARTDCIARICKVLEKENVAYDIKNYRDAPAGLRIWCGATVEPQDINILTGWLDWAYESVKAETVKKAA